MVSGHVLMQADVSFRDTIQKAKIQAITDGTKYFLPQGELQKTCGRKTVFNRFREVAPEKADLYTAYIFGDTEYDPSFNISALALFVILEMIGELQKFGRFFEAGVNDAELPLSWKDKVLCTQNGRKVHGPEQTHPCFLVNEDRFKAEFYREQWEILPTIISKTDTSQGHWPCFHPHAIMPWTQMVLKKESGFSDVYKVKPHPSNHTLGDDEHFALKVLKSNGTTDSDFKRELYALAKMPPNPHVLELISAFKHGDRACLLFKWAGGGSLASLMEESPSILGLSTTVDPGHLIDWIIKQMAGLAGGLNGIHDVHDPEPEEHVPSDQRQDFYGIHGDVKPDNILHFFTHDAAGKLVLSDFGLTRFHTKASRSQRRGNGPMSPTYASPEHHEYMCGVSRRSDVWALGCVFTELLTWALRGPEAHRAYEETRFFEDDIGREKGIWHMDRFFRIEFMGEGDYGHRFLKNAVLENIEENKDAATQLGNRGGDFIRILDFIGQRMLKVDHYGRATCDEVCQFLKSVC